MGAGAAIGFLFGAGLARRHRSEYSDINSLNIRMAVENALKDIEFEKKWVYHGNAPSLPPGFDPPDTFEKHEEAWKKQN